MLGYPFPPVWPLAAKYCEYLAPNRHVRELEWMKKMLICKNKRYRALIPFTRPPSIICTRLKRRPPSSSFPMVYLLFGYLGEEGESSSQHLPEFENRICHIVTLDTLKFKKSNSIVVSTWNGKDFCVICSGKRFAPHDEVTLTLTKERIIELKNTTISPTISILMQHWPLEWTNRYSLINQLRSASFTPRSVPSALPQHWFSTYLHSLLNSFEPPTQLTSPHYIIRFITVNGAMRLGLHRKAGNT